MLGIPQAQNQQTEDKEIKARSARLTQSMASEAQAGLVRWQIESLNELQEMERFLLGYVWVIKKDAQEEDAYQLVQSGKRWMNEKGATGVISVIRPYLSKSFILSNFSEELVKSMMKDIAISLIQYLGYWQEEFEIESGDLSMILTMLLDSIEANLRRAIDMRTFDGFTTTYKTQEEFGKKDIGKKNFLSKFSSAFKLTS